MPKDAIWSSVASRVDADSSSRGASKVTVWREDAPAAGAHASMAMSGRIRKIRRIRWGAPAVLGRAGLKRGGPGGGRGGAGGGGGRAAAPAPGGLQPANTQQVAF